MNLKQARLVNPVLTTAVQGIKDAALVGHSLFPRVDVSLRAGTTVVFDKDTDIEGSLIRAPGAEREMFTPGYSGAEYGIVQRSLAAKVPVETAEEAEGGAGVDVATRGIALVKKQLDKKIEIAQATLARDAARYANSHKKAVAGTDKWTDPSSNPLKQLEDAAQAIRNKTGVRPNTLMLSAKAFGALKFHPLIQERLKFGNLAVLTASYLAALIDIPNVVIGEAVAHGADVWGDDAVLAYVAVGSMTQEEPSYGYTYTLAGTPAVLSGYFDPATDSWIYPVNVEAVPVMAWAGAGYLFKSVV